MNQELIESLRRQDWRFPTRKSGEGIEAIHPYPAKFIAEIPGKIIDVLGVPDGTCVFDPFCGSGTSLVEAQRRGYSSIGIDLNPVACLISRVKTAPRPHELLRVATAIAESARRIGDPTVPSIPNLDHWFEKSIQVAIASLIEEINQHSQEDCYDALRLSLSSVLVRVSNQESDTRYAAVKKNIEPDDVYRLFALAAEKIDKALTAREWSGPSCSVIQSDILTVSPDTIVQPVGLVITSPPYPNAYEYWLYHKYRMWWLGFDPLAVKEAEIGARAHFFKVNRHTTNSFREQMTHVMKLLHAVVTTGGAVCIVIGRSKIHGEIVDNAATLIELGERVGFRFSLRLEREIAAHKKSFNLSHANIKTESIVAFTKE